MRRHPSPFGSTARFWGGLVSPLLAMFCHWNSTTD
jgi:hypothetical protein